MKREALSWGGAGDELGRVGQAVAVKIVVGIHVLDRKHVVVAIRVNDLEFPRIGQPVAVRIARNGADGQAGLILRHEDLATTDGEGQRPDERVE